MMKKAAFGHARSKANVVQRGGAVAFAADDFERGVQQLGF